MTVFLDRKKIGESNEDGYWRSGLPSRITNETPAINKKTPNADAHDDGQR
jgi:hypothetical protein